MKRPRRRPARPASAEAEKLEESPVDVYRAMWIELTPAERLRRSWRLRARVKDIDAVHDEKSLPKL